jgi:predicted transcriptional regulator
MNQVTRGKPEIIIKILEEAKTPQTMAALSQKASLNLAAGRRYVNALSKANYLDEIEGSKKPEYQINMDGIEFLKTLRKSSMSLERFYKYW